jgi:hypothetical protein
MLPFLKAVYLYEINLQFLRTTLLKFCPFLMLQSYRFYSYYLILWVSNFIMQAEKKDRIRQLKLEQGAAKVAEELQKCKLFLKSYCLFLYYTYSNVVNF